MRFGKESDPEKQKEQNDHAETKKVSKNIGEYVDFEEIKKNIHWSACCCFYFFSQRVCKNKIIKRFTV